MEALPGRSSPVQLLAHVARRIGASLDLTQTLDAVAEAVVEALDFETAVVNQVVETGHLEVVAVAGSEEARAALLGTCTTRAVFEALFAAAEGGGPVYFVPGGVMSEISAAHPDLHVYVPDMEVSADGDAWHPEDALFATMTGSTGELIGVLSVDVPRDGRRPCAEKRDLLAAFATHAALALEHAGMHSRLRAVEQELRHQATHDPLTGLPNRTFLMQQVDVALATLDRAGGLLAFAFCDLDNFKEVNDTCGHTVGDTVLVEVARQLRLAIRPSDVVARYGGDEFVVLCSPVHGLEDAVHIAERIAESVAAPVTAGGRIQVVTASIGLTLASSGTAADRLLAEADSALYAAKARGGACWQLYDTVASDAEEAASA